MDSGSGHKRDIIAVQSWNCVPHRTRREVRKYAREGRLHPDPRVTEMSIKWAEAVLRKVPRKERRIEFDVNFMYMTVYMVFLGVADFLTGADGAFLGGSSGNRGKHSLLEKRTARRIMNLRD